MSEEDNGSIVLVNGLRPLIEVPGGAYRVTDGKEIGDLLLYKKTESGGYSLPIGFRVPFFLKRQDRLLRCEGILKTRDGHADLFVRDCMPIDQPTWMPPTQLSPAAMLGEPALYAVIESKEAIDAIVKWVWKIAAGRPMTVRSARSSHPALADLSPVEVFNALRRNGEMVIHNGVVSFAAKDWLEHHLKFRIEEGIYRQEFYVDHDIPPPAKRLLWVIKD